MSSAEFGDLGRCPFYNAEVGSANLCIGRVKQTVFNYSVTEWTCILFVVLFGLSSILHLIQAILSRRWYLLSSVFICAVTETLGWSARLWASVSTQWYPENGGHFASNSTAFLMQISTLIFAPAFLAAGWYWSLGILTRLLGPQYCRFNPTLFAITFIIGDAASLIVQAIGGGQASAADTLQDANEGARVMYIGVLVQAAVMVLYCLVLAEFVVRFHLDRPVKPFRVWKTQPAAAVPRDTIPQKVVRKAKIFIGAMVFSTILIFIRSIYRTVELVEGWTGPIISNEALFCTLDALMVLLATAAFNVIHPLWYLPRVSCIEEQPRFQQEIDEETTKQSHVFSNVRSPQDSDKIASLA